MFTPTHGFLTSLFNRFTSANKWSRARHCLFVLGSIIPDLPMWAVGITEGLKYTISHPGVLQWRWIKKGFWNVLEQSDQSHLIGSVRFVFDNHRSLVWLHQFLHSLPFWLMIVGLTLIVFRGKLSKFKQSILTVCGGAIFFHIVVDWLTHTANAHNHLWPLTNGITPGVISHENPLLWTVEIGIFCVWLLALITPPVTQLLKLAWALFE